MHTNLFYIKHKGKEEFGRAENDLTHLGSTHDLHVVAVGKTCDLKQTGEL